MSGLKSAWELSLERSNEMLPDMKKSKKLTQKQKEEIAEIRREYHARIADKDVSLQDKLKKLGDRIPPEEIELALDELKRQFATDKTTLEEEMEKKIESVRGRSR